MERKDARERSKALKTLETVQQLFEPPENAAILAFSFLAPSLALGLGDPVACRRSASFKSWPAARSWGFPNAGTSRLGVRGLLAGPFETGMFQEERPMDGLERVLQGDSLLRTGASPNDHMDVGGRAMPGAIAEGCAGAVWRVLETALSLSAGSLIKMTNADTPAHSNNELRTNQILAHFCEQRCWNSHLGRV